MNPDVPPRDKSPTRSTKHSQYQKIGTKPRGGIKITIEAAQNIAQRSRKTTAPPKGTRRADIAATLDKINRKTQEEDLISWAEENGFLFSYRSFAQKHHELDGTCGQESDVYFHQESQTYLKMNSGIAYKDWLQFFEFLSMHNTIFPATKYTLLGLSQDAKGKLHAYLEQPAVRCTRNRGASRERVMNYMSTYGFSHVGYDHYENESIQVMDLHDENVLEGIDSHLYFIDTSIYVKPYT